MKIQTSFWTRHVATCCILILVSIPSFGHADKLYVQFQSTRLFCIIQPPSRRVATIRNNGKVSTRSFAEIKTAAKQYFLWAKSRTAQLLIEQKNSANKTKKKKLEAAIARVKSGIADVVATKKFAANCRQGKLDAQAISFIP